jgi:hypothetical protein
METSTGTTVLQKILLVVAWAILPAAAFQAAFSGQMRVFVRDHRRLKAACSQDWLPHFCNKLALGRTGIRW